MLIFILLGVQMFFFHVSYYNWALIFVTIASCIAGRLVHVFFLTTIMNITIDSSSTKRTQIRLISVRFWYLNIISGIDTYFVPSYCNYLLLGYSVFTSRRNEKILCQQKVWYFHRLVLFVYNKEIQCHRLDNNADCIFLQF